MIITSIILALFAAPIFSLNELSKRNTDKATTGAILILLLCAAIFAGMMSLVTNAGRNELFAATAAYCAVLIVFVGTQNN